MLVDQDIIDNEFLDKLRIPQQEQEMLLQSSNEQEKNSKKEGLQVDYLDLSNVNNLKKVVSFMNQYFETVKKWEKENKSPRLLKEEELEKEKDQAWIENQKQMKALSRKDGFAKLVEELGEDRIFKKVKSKQIVCIDERVAESKVSFGELGVAGSGILEKNLRKEIKKGQGPWISYLKELVKNDNLKAISSHGRRASSFACGAAENYTKKLELQNDSDMNGYVFAAKLADILSIDHFHYLDDKQKGHPQFHSARAVYVDSSSTLDRSALAPGFLISPKLAPKNERETMLRKNIKIPIKIILSDHGFAERIEENNKIIIVLISESSQELAEEKKVVNEALEELREKVDKKVKSKVEIQTFSKKAV